ncbi:hypothetical protein [Aeromonas veronii]
MPDIAQFDALDAGKAGLIIEPLASMFPVGLTEGTPLEANQTTR